MTVLTITHLLAAGTILVALWFMPVLNHATPFGVNTPTSQLDHPTIKAALTKYRRWLAVIAAAWLVTVALMSTPTAVLVSLQVAPLVAIACAIALSYQCSKPIRAAKKDEEWYRGVTTGVVVDIAEPPLSRMYQPWGLWLLSFAPMICAAAHITYHYPQIPDMVPTHYGLDGPDAWTAKTIGSAYMGVWAGLGLSVMMFGLSFVPAKQPGVTPQGSPAIGLYLKAAATKAQRVSFAVSALIVNIFFCALALLTFPDGKVGSGPMAILYISFFLGLLLPALWSMRASTRLPPEIAATAGELEDPDEDHLWKLGIFYVNKDNPNMLVQKRQGIGQTVNFARWEVWLLAAIILIPQPAILYFAAR